MLASAPERPRAYRAVRLGDRALRTGLLLLILLPTAAIDNAAPAEAASPTLAKSAALPAGPKGVAASGALPDTNYTPPKNAVFLSPKGQDGNQGSAGSPVRSINRAVALAPEGGTVVFRGGVYRDWFHNKQGDDYGIVAKSLTFQAYPHEKPWIDGTDVVPTSAWKKVGSRYQASWATPTFCDGEYYSRSLDAQSVKPNTGPCTHFDMHPRAGDGSSGDPQMLFLNGKALTQVKDEGKLTKTTFVYDWKARRLVLGTNPAGSLVEATKRPVAMVLGGRKNYTVRGLGFRRFATNEYHNLTAAAVYIGRGVSRVENTVFTKNAAGGLAYSSPLPRSVVKRSVFVDNGFTPLQGSGNAKEGLQNDFVIDSNVFLRNNTAGFGTTCSISCAQAAVKLARMQGLRIANNLVADTRGKRAAGIWCDLDCSDTEIVHNVVRDHDGAGIFYEVSNTGVIAGNVSVRNQYGIAVPSANTKVYNNTLVDNIQGIKVYDDWRTRGQDGWDDVGPDTRNVEVVNNIVYGKNYAVLALPMRDNSAKITGPEEQLSRLDYNAFYQRNKTPVFVYWRASNGKETLYRSKGSFSTDRGFGRRDIWSHVTKDPFVNVATGDYRVTSASLAYRSAVTLPKDVAKALGQPADAKLSRGAVARS